MKEASKANARRLRKFSRWCDVFRGVGIDIGSGDDPLPAGDWPGIIGLRTFDLADGDANVIDELFEPESFNFVHASHCLEHMNDPVDAARRWLRLVKPGGSMVITVPDFLRYEQLHWPSRFNTEHKSTWSIDLPASPCPLHQHANTFLSAVCRGNAAIGTVDLVDTNYDYTKLGSGEDQTIRFEDGVECCLEFLIRKL